MKFLPSIHRTLALCFVAVLFFPVNVVGQNRVGGGCQPNLSHLEGMLFEYTHSELLEMRRAVLATDIRSVIAHAASSGLSTAQTARQLLEQSKDYDEMLMSAREAVFAVSGPEFRGSLEATLRAIDQNQGLPNNAPGLDSGMTGNAVKGYILAHWGRLANKEVAVQVACFANQ